MSEHDSVWKRLRGLPKTVRALQGFHQTHKLQFMAHDPRGYADLGRVAANSGNLEVAEAFAQYEVLLSELLQKPLTVPKTINAYQHMMGYFKKQISPTEKTQILAMFKDYEAGRLPLSALAEHFRALVDLHSIEYLRGQSILEGWE